MKPAHERIADEIVEELFVNGSRQRADRLVLTTGGRYLGGWCEKAVRDIISRRLAAANREHEVAQIRTYIRTVVEELEVRTCRKLLKGMPSGFWSSDAASVARSKQAAQLVYSMSAPLSSTETTRIYRSR